MGVLGAMPVADGPEGSADWELLVYLVAQEPSSSGLTMVLGLAL